MDTTAISGEGTTENGGEESPDEEESEREEGTERPLLDKPQLALEWLGSLNALRVSRQYYDVTLVAANGMEVVAHRCVLAAAVPELLVAPSSARYRVRASGAALSRLVELLYTGRLQSGAPPEQLYEGAWRLRLEAARVAAARRLPATLGSRRLPDLPSRTRARLDRWLGIAFPRLLAGGQLDRLPSLRLELSPGTQSIHSALTLASQVLLYVRRSLEENGSELETVCSRRRVVEYDERGDLRDVFCGEDEDRLESACILDDEQHEKLPELGQREPTSHWRVIAAEILADGAAAALLEAGHDLLRTTVVWRQPTTPPQIAPRQSVAAPAPRLARMTLARSALGLAVSGGRLLAAGGYDREAVLTHAERYCPRANRWLPAPCLPGARARFSLVPWAGELLAVGGSDGQKDLASVLSLGSEGEGRWSARRSLNRARSQAGAAAGGGSLWAVGGAEDGVATRSVLKLEEDGRWEEGPRLKVARAEAGVAGWRGALWAVGGRDNWSCLSSVESLSFEREEWECAASLPGGARRSCAVVVFQECLLVLGGADGAASLRRCEVGAVPDLSRDICWRNGPCLKEPRAAAAAAVLDDTLYVVGGYSGKEFLSCMECLRSLDGVWTSLLVADGPSASIGDPLTDEELPE